MVSKRTLPIFAASFILMAGLGFAVPAYSAEKGASIVLFDFEGSDTGKATGGEISRLQARSGKASLLWNNHPSNTSLNFAGIPTDWTKYNQLSFWIYSENANNAEFMMIVRSEDESSEGMDYYSTEIKVDWKGWRLFEFQFGALGAARKPRGWDHIDNLSFTASGWNNEPKADTMLYIDDVRLETASMNLRNASFDEGQASDGIPFRWSVEPPAKADKGQVRVVAEGRTGQGIEIRDASTEDGLGVQQRMGAQPGKTFKVSCWKKGDPVGLYFRWIGARDAMIRMDSIKMTNKNAGAFERFTLEGKCPDDAKSVLVWVYSFRGTKATAVVDDFELEVVD